MESALRSASFISLSVRRNGAGGSLDFSFFPRFPLPEDNLKHKKHDNEFPFPQVTGIF